VWENAKPFDDPSSSMRRSSAALHFAHSADPGSSVLLLNEDNVFVAHKGRLPFPSLITKPRTRASIARTSEPRRQPSQKPPMNGSVLASLTTAAGGPPRGSESAGPATRTPRGPTRRTGGS